MTPPNTEITPSRHTPGPIYVDIRTGVAVLSSKPTPNCLDGGFDGELMRIYGEGESVGAYQLITAEQEANMHLWAAAPDMLSALKAVDDLLNTLRCELLEANSGLVPEWTAHNLVIAAIAKAEKQP